jgi:pimeloyl-ACP methyl ester carboxylesterase
VRATCVPAGRPALLVGHSLGAMTIVGWADTQRRRLSHLVHGAVLADTGVDQLHSTFFAELGVAKLLADTLGVRAFRSRLPIPRRTTPISTRLTRFMGLGPDAPPSAVALTEQLFVDCPADVRSAIGTMLGSLDLAAGLAHLSVPTTVVTGTADRLTPPSHARRLVERLPDADLVEYADAGHQAPLEQPEAFTALVRERATAAGERASA